MGPEVQKSQTLRSLWFESGDGIRDSIIHKITPLQWRLIDVYIDYRDFKIPPWKRGANREDIPKFWIRTLRNFQRLESEAQEHKMAKQRMEQDEAYQRHLQKQRRQQGKPDQRQARTVQKRGQAPSERAAKDYLKWRQEQLKAKKKQEADRHEQLVRRQQQQRQRRVRRGRSSR